MTDIYIGLGSNLGDRGQLLQQAVQLLKETDGVAVTAISPVYETPPWGKTDQPPFLNAVAAVETALTPATLLQVCQHIEQVLGRVRHEKWGARTIDLDLLYCEGITIHSPQLQLPHPYLTQRAFVLVPLQDIAPSLQIEGKDLSALIRAVSREAAQMHKVGNIEKMEETHHGKNPDC
jgi:2-amino-4-hydroxy-6-hydroxymethyldihydropteridine diphosphokinase